MGTVLTLLEVADKTGVTIYSVRCWVYQVKALKSTTQRVNGKIRRVVQLSDLQAFAKKRKLILKNSPQD